MNRKEAVLLLASVALTLAVALGLIRWLAPGLLGAPRDLQLVQTGEQIAPFYEGVFRPEQFKTSDFMLKDPRTLNRPAPFYGEQPEPGIGPHDVLGFRNRSVPAVADVVTIGDSQTYGINAQLEDNWPSQAARLLGDRVVYSMAAGGWGAVQYLDMFYNACAFRPQVIVVALYSGNDALESFQLAYGSEQWRALRADPDAKPADVPSIPFPAPASEQWRAPFKTGATLFTPTLRLRNNEAQRAVDAGYGVMRKVLATMAQVAQKAGIKLVVTVIPTKELAYARLVDAEKLAPPADYSALVKAETGRIAALADGAAKLPGTTYVDVVAPLQQHALAGDDLYPLNINGHPIEGGYRVIGETVAHAIEPLLSPPLDGWVQLPINKGEGGLAFLVRDHVAWLFADGQQMRDNGWTGVIRARPVTPRQLATLPKRSVPGVDPARFGPRGNAAKAGGQ